MNMALGSGWEHSDFLHEDEETDISSEGDTHQPPVSGYPESLDPAGGYTTDDGKCVCDDKEVDPYPDDVAEEDDDGDEDDDDLDIDDILDKPYAG